MKLLRGCALTVVLCLGLPVRAEILSEFFAGTIDLSSGDISSFFFSGTTNPLPGVCVMLDVDTALPGTPGSVPEPSDGLNEAPSSAGGTKDGFMHPSGFNQRRIMSAYNPNVFGGTVYVGIDLPGGTGTEINRRFFNSDYGNVTARGQVLPFDADGNGHPDGIGLDVRGGIISGCLPDFNDPDIWSCLDQSFGATDNPRDTSVTRGINVREFYTVLLAFGDFSGVSIDFEVTHDTPPGQADLRVFQSSGQTFGVNVSSDTGTSGVPLGYDVIFAVTNVNANVDARSRLLQYVGVHSGSNQDGSGQGEDFNDLQCVYDTLESTLNVTVFCPPTNSPPGTLLVITGEVCNLGTEVLTDVLVTNTIAGGVGERVLGPATLAPGECQPYVRTVLVPADEERCALAGIVTARGTKKNAGGAEVTASATADCPTREGEASIMAETFCPPTATAPGQSLVFTGWICNDGDFPLTGIVVTNWAFGITTNFIVGPFDLVPGQCIGYTGSYVIPLTLSECTVTHTVTATALACGGTVVRGSDTRTCPVVAAGEVNCLARCAEQADYWAANLERWPGTYAASQTLGTVFSQVSRNTADNTFLDALRENTPGSVAIRQLLRQGVAAVLNSASANITFPFTTSEVIAMVDDALQNGGTRTLTNTAAVLQQANETESCPPCLEVLMQVGGLMPGDAVGPMSDTAIGYRGLADPAFGYSITVSNCGAIPLTSLSAVDSQWGDMSETVFADLNGTLGARKSVTKFYKAFAWMNTTNEIRVRGRSLGPDAREVMVQDKAVVKVEDATISCQALITSVADQDGNPLDDHVELPANGTAHRVRVKLVVCNPGPVALKGVMINPASMPCKPAGPFKLAPGKCITNELCVQTVDCRTTPLSLVFNVTGTLDAATGAGISDSSGQRIRVSCQTAGLIECAPEGPPAFTLTTSANKAATEPGGAVSYSYTVNNTGAATLTRVEIQDDGGTPDFVGDDLIVGTIPVLAPGATRTVVRTLFLPTRLCDDSSGEDAGTLSAQVLDNGNVRVTFLQDLAVTDNSYGVNAIGWGAIGGHQLGQLAESDSAEFQLRNKAGEAVLQFRQDYLSTRGSDPGGFGTLGVTGGDGAIIVGNPNRLVKFSSSLADNLNRAPFLADAARYTADSPGIGDPLSAAWEYRSIYSVEVDKRAFGASGYGSATIIDVHNSAAKKAAPLVPTCDGCVTSSARATAYFGNGWLTNFAATVVCATNRAPAPCPAPSAYWATHNSAWQRFAQGQAIASVFAESARYGNAADQTLLKAVKGRAGTGEVRDLLEQGIAALLNAEAMGNGYSFSREDIVDAVNMALSNGSTEALTALTELLTAANDDAACEANAP